MADVVVVSSHLDDAVFSCWSIIGDPSLEVSVVTVFTVAAPGVRGSWDACIDPDVDSEVRVSERQAEDRSALQIAGRDPVHLPFYDSQFGLGLPDPSEVAEALEPHLLAADAVYVPLAIFNDEHVLVRDAARRIRRRPSFYVDYPYALRYPAIPSQPSGGLLHGYEPPTIVSLAQETVDNKLAACRKYAGELERLRECADFGDFVTVEELGHETLQHPVALD
jgi:LmbE family N-acetylglucosaminyl deacetylase